MISKIKCVCFLLLIVFSSCNPISKIVSHRENECELEEKVYIFVLNKIDCYQCNSIRLRDFIAKNGSKNNCKIFFILEDIREIEKNKMLTEDMGFSTNELMMVNVITDSKLFIKLNNKFKEFEFTSYYIKYNSLNKIVDEIKKLKDL